MRYRAIALVSLLAAAVPAAQQAVKPAARDDARVLDQIRREGLDRSQVIALFDHFVTINGPRLTGSPQHKAAAEWARAQLATWGLANPRLEPFEFGRGWQLQRQTVDMIEPRYMPLMGYAEAWSASTKGDVIGTPVMIGGRTPQEIAAMRDKLVGAIVMTQPIMTTFIRQDRLQPTDHDEAVAPGQPRAPGTGGGRQNQSNARTIAQTLREAGAAVVLRTSQGEHGTMFVSGRDLGENAMPSIVLAGEHYNMVARMIERGLPVTLRINLQTRYLTEDTRSYNLIAELPGSDPSLKDEIVMIGAHLDSWHSATGASDNADGSATVLEAMRILKAIGVRPRRTIRVAIWSGEEQGLLGSRAYVRQHFAGDANAAERDRVAIYLNIDPGTGPIYGWYLENTAEARPLFDAWLAPLRDLGARRNIAAGIGSTDHVAFRDAGIPAFNPAQDYVNYDVRTHHTNVDTYERVRDEDLKQCAIVMAWFAYQAAMMNDKLPRPVAATR